MQAQLQGSRCRSHDYKGGGEAFRVAAAGPRLARSARPQCQAASTAAAAPRLAHSVRPPQRRQRGPGWHAAHAHSVRPPQRRRRRPGWRVSRRDTEDSRGGARGALCAGPSLSWSESVRRTSTNLSVRRTSTNLSVLGLCWVCPGPSLCWSESVRRTSLSLRWTESALDRVCWTRPKALGAWAGSGSAAV
jgi:hypothetical protein